VLVYSGTLLLVSAGTVIWSTHQLVLVNCGGRYVGAGSQPIGQCSLEFGAVNAR
jgi:hypothetical protein